MRHPAAFARSLVRPFACSLPLLLTLAIVAPLRAQSNVAVGPPMPLDARTKARIYDSMRDDLKALVVAQESWFAEKAEYIDRFTRGAVKGLTLKVSPGVTVTITYATKTTWAARATHAWMPGKSCVIRVGDVAPSRMPTTAASKRPPARSGIPVCDVT